MIAAVANMAAVTDLIMDDVFIMPTPNVKLRGGALLRRPARTQG